ncbi:MAG: hypothetical protein IT337_03135 [Thermomicrobiales bacterium]|nr:hypothetical protein [Thermomicrobiales bacterium]
MLDTYRDLIDELLGTPQTVRQLVTAGSVTPKAAALIAQTRDRDRLELVRLNRMLHETAPYLPPIRELAAEPVGDIEATLAEMEQARGDLISLLMNLTLKDWERTATDDVEGEILLADEVERHVEFDESQLACIRTALGGDGE